MVSAVDRLPLLSDFLSVVVAYALRLARPLDMAQGIDP